MLINFLTRSVVVGHHLIYDRPSFDLLFTLGSWLVEFIIPLCFIWTDSPHLHGGALQHSPHVLDPLDIHVDVVCVGKVLRPRLHQAESTGLWRCSQNGKSCALVINTIQVYYTVRELDRKCFVRTIFTFPWWVWRFYQNKSTSANVHLPELQCIFVKPFAFVPSLLPLDRLATQLHGATTVTWTIRCTTSVTRARRFVRWEPNTADSATGVWRCLTTTAPGLTTASASRIGETDVTWWLTVHNAHVLVS